MHILAGAVSALLCHPVIIYYIVQSYCLFYCQDTLYPIVTVVGYLESCTAFCDFVPQSCDWIVTSLSFILIITQYFTQSPIGTTPTSLICASHSRHNLLPPLTIIHMLIIERPITRFTQFILCL